MKKIGFIVFIFALALGVIIAGAFSFGKFSVDQFSFSRSVKGSGDLKTEKRHVSDFKSIDVGGVFRVEVTIQENFDVQVEADENLLQYIRTEVDGETLEISSEKRFSSANPIIVRIGAPDLSGIEASGASKVELVNLNNRSFELDLSGAAGVTVKGITNDLVIEQSGASRLYAEELKAENARVESSGASKSEIFVSNRLDANISGASNVKYSGSPKDLSKHVSGAASIREK